MFEKSEADFWLVLASFRACGNAALAWRKSEQRLPAESSHDGGKDAYRIMGKTAGGWLRTRRTDFPVRRFQV